LDAPKELKGSQLPLCIEVVQHMQYVKEKLSQERGPGVIPVIDLAKQTAERVVGLWNKASIPAIALKFVIQKIIRLHSKCRQVGNL